MALLYVKCLQKEEVSFDQPTWEGRDISSGILDDFYLIIRSIESIPYIEKERLVYDRGNFAKLKSILSGKMGILRKKKFPQNFLRSMTNKENRLKMKLWNWSKNDSKISRAINSIACSGQFPKKTIQTRF